MLKKKLQGKKNKGSALVVTLFVLAIILISALSITLTAVKERKASIGDVSSGRSYQTAEIGVEEVMQVITRGNCDYINKSGGNNNLWDELESADFSCEDGVLEKEDYAVELFDFNSAKIDCDDNSRLVSEIAKIKSIGGSAGAKRAMEALVSNKITKLLLHFKEEDPILIVDSSYTSPNPGYEINNYGVTFSDNTPTAVASTEYGEFFTGKYLEIGDKNSNDDIDFNFQDKDFTIEAWIDPDTTFSSQNLTIVSSDNQFRFYYRTSLFFSTNGILIFEYYPDGVGGPITSEYTINLGSAWHHVAVVRKEDNLYFFVDGAKKPGSDLIGIIKNEPDKDIYIGALFNGSSPFRGNIDELRITKGVARWTDDFTPWDIEYAPNN